MIDKEITREDFLTWKESYITKGVFKELEAQRDRLISEMQDLHVFLLENEIDRGRRVGLIEGLNVLLGIEFEDAEEQIEEQSK